GARKRPTRSSRSPCCWPASAASSRGDRRPARSAPPKPEIRAILSGRRVIESKDPPGLKPRGFRRTSMQALAREEIDDSRQVTRSRGVSGSGGALGDHPGSGTSSARAKAAAASVPSNLGRPEGILETLAGADEDQAVAGRPKMRRPEEVWSTLVTVRSTSWPTFEAHSSAT